MKHAVVTGLGIISSIGNNQQKVLASLCEGRLGITFSRELKDSGVRSHVWDNIKLDTTGPIDRKAMRFMSDASIYAFLSVERAIANAGLSPGAYQNSPRVSLIVGFGGDPPRFWAFGVNVVRGPRGLKVIGPYAATKAMASDVFACLATPFKIYGINYSTSSACATSAHYIDNTVEWIQPGRQGIVFAGGGEELCQEMACEFDAMGTLSTKYNDAPEETSRTYDAHRDGLAIAGGGGMVVVGELEHALACGTHAYAEVVGYGVTSDDADMVVPSGEGAVRCTKVTMHGADTLIDYLNSYGTPTPVGGVKELATTREVFGDKSPTISATKAMIGHSLGVAGVQEAIYSLLVLEYGSVTPSTNIEELDEQVAGLNAVTETINRRLTTVMSNNFGFGGTNATLVMRKLED